MRQWQYLGSVEPAQTIPRTGLLNPPAPCMDLPPRAAVLPTAVLVTACFFVGPPVAATIIPWAQPLATPTLTRHVTAESVSVGPITPPTVAQAIPWAVQQSAPAITPVITAQSFTVGPIAAPAVAQALPWLSPLPLPTFVTPLTAWSAVGGLTPGTVTHAVVPIQWYQPLATPPALLSPRPWVPSPNTGAGFVPFIASDPDIHRIPVEEFFPWQRMVIEFRNSPPGGATKGQRYIVDTAPTGAWIGHTHDLAWWYETAWKFDTPVQGWFAYNLDDATLYVFTGATWQAFNSGGSWIPAVDGSEPPVFITDGSGVLILVAGP